MASSKLFLKTTMRIENIEQLNTEIRKLEVKSVELKAQLKQDYEEIKEELKPLNILIDTVSDITGFKINRESLFEKGFAIGLQILMQRMFQLAESGVEKQVGAIIDKASTIISQLYNKFFHKHKKQASPEEDGNYE